VACLTVWLWMKAAQTSSTWDSVIDRLQGFFSLWMWTIWFNNLYQL
jgi:hypothetical protein